MAARLPAEALRFEFKGMGSPCVLHLHPSVGVDVERVAERGIAEVGRLEARYSRYREDSILSAINRSAGAAEGIEVDGETASLLDYAEIAFRQSDGMFDVSSGVLREAWDFRSNRVPGNDEIEAVRSRVGWRKLSWQSPRLVLPRGMELDFGGMVKEYAADRVAQLCRSAGVIRGLVDLGGDLCVVGPHPGGSPWRVGIRDPRRPETAMATIPLVSGGLASSGDYERFMIVDGVRYGHLLDPRTGRPVDGLRSVSVASSHCMIAGTASTIAMLKGEAEGARWLDELGLPHLRMDRSGRLAGTLQPGSAGAARWAATP